MVCIVPLYIILRSYSTCKYNSQPVSCLSPPVPKLHKLFLPTLAATQSRYPAEVVSALTKAGFSVVESAPSKAPAWPLTDQKTDLFLAMRRVVQVSLVCVVDVFSVLE